MQLDERKSHPRIDLTGQRFDRLTVLGPAPIRRAPNGKTRRYRLCRCDCGAEIETRIDQLIHGITRSCGCLQRETAAEVARSRTTQKTLALREKRAERKTKGLRSNLGVRDLIGKRFGLLTVLEFAFVKKQKSFWACVCDCGDAAVVTASRLNFSHTKSCGCLQREQQTKHKEYNFKHGYAVGTLHSGILVVVRNETAMPEPELSPVTKTTAVGASASMNRGSIVSRFFSPTWA